MLEGGLDSLMLRSFDPRRPAGQIRGQRVGRFFMSAEVAQRSVLSSLLQIIAYDEVLLLKNFCSKIETITSADNLELTDRQNRPRSSSRAQIQCW